MPLPYTVFTFSSHVSVDRYFRLRNILFYCVRVTWLGFWHIFQKYSSSSPTIPDAKIRTESRTSSPIDSRTSSMTSLTPDEECLVSAGDEEEFVLIPSPMTRQRSKTVSLSIFFMILWPFFSVILPLIFIRVYVSDLITWYSLILSSRDVSRS